MARFYPVGKKEHQEELAKYGKRVYDGIKEKCGYGATGEHKKMGYNSYEECVRDSLDADLESLMATRKRLDSGVPYDDTKSPKTGATLERYRVSTFNQLTPKYQDRTMTKSLKIIYSPRLDHIHSALKDGERIQPAFRYGTDLAMWNNAMIRDLRKASESAEAIQEMVEEL